MYLDHFGLSAPPFRITPDPGLFFPGGDRGAVLQALRYAVSNGEGIVKVVGEVGSGKTMLCRMLHRELPESVEVVYLANPSLAPEEVLHAVAFELGLAPAGDTHRLEVMQALQRHLLERHGQNRRVVLFVEEAQGMPVATLEELRLLSNLETTTEKLLQIVLFGQPELDATLARHDLRQFRERITFSFDLKPLSRIEVRDYLLARLRACGYRMGELFSPAAVRAIAHHSEGLLRRINILADKALLAAFAAGSPRVERRHVEQAARDSGFKVLHPRLNPYILAGLGLLLLALLLAALWWWWSESAPASSATAGLAAPEATKAGDAATATDADAALIARLLRPPEPDLRPVPDYSPAGAAVAQP